MEINPHQRYGHVDPLYSNVRFAYELVPYSRFYMTASGASAEFAVTRNEGVIGIAAFLEGERTTSRAVVLSTATVIGCGHIGCNTSSNATVYSPIADPLQARSMNG